MDFNNTITHYFIAVFVVILVTYQSRRFMPVPRAVVLLTFLGILVSAYWNFSIVSLQNSYPVAILTNDLDEVVSYKLRTSLSRAARLLERRGFGRYQPQRYFGNFSEPQEVTDFFKSNPNLALLIWGNKKWLNLSFPENSKFQIAELKYLPEHSWLRKVNLLSSVPNVSISRQPQDSTAEFISLVSQAMMLAKRSQAPNDLFAAQTLLRVAGELEAHWLGPVHRALPWFMLGNLKLKSFLQQEVYQPAELECIITHFRRARGYLRAKDLASADLYVAVYNNLAIAEALKGTVERDPNAKKNARKRFKRGLILATVANMYKLDQPASLIIRENLGLLETKTNKLKRNK